MPTLHDLKSYLDSLVDRFETPAFIPPDPICIPHGFDDPRDQEIIALYTALLAWGQRKTILKKMEELCERMNFQPSNFVRRFDMSRDAHRLSSFRHRTFQPIDAVWLTRNLSLVLKRFDAIENVFAYFMAPDAKHTQTALQGFSDLIATIDPETPSRLRKHLARPDSKSACKRLNMYLRWMVRPGPVDFGIWTSIRPSQLVLPLDVHSGRQARELGMLSRMQDDWNAALELTENCRKFCAGDPCKYDYAFFGIGANRIQPDNRFTGNNKMEVSLL